jgi:hypothetical protein
MTRVLERTPERLTGRRRDRKLPAVNPAKVPTTGSVLAGYRPGTWVVLKPDMTEVIGAGASPDEALRRAGIDPSPTTEDDDEPRPIMLQVLDPLIKCL